MPFRARCQPADSAPFFRLLRLSALGVDTSSLPWHATLASIRPAGSFQPWTREIAALKSTTFLGRRFTRRQIADIRETVELFPNDSPQRAVEDHLRAPGLDHAEGRLPRRGGPAASRAPGGVRDPDPSGEARHGGEVAHQAGRPRAGVRPAARDRLRARRPGAAVAGGGGVSGGRGAVEGAGRQAPPSRMPAGPSGRASAGSSASAGCTSRSATPASSCSRECTHDHHLDSALIDNDVFSPSPSQRGNPPKIDRCSGDRPGRPGDPVIHDPGGVTASSYPRVPVRTR